MIKMNKYYDMCIRQPRKASALIESQEAELKASVTTKYHDEIVAEAMQRISDMKRERAGQVIYEVSNEANEANIRAKLIEFGWSTPERTEELEKIRAAAIDIPPAVDGLQGNYQNGWNTSEARRCLKERSDVLAALLQESNS